MNAAETYLLYCDCQPLPLFHRSTFTQTIRNRDPEVLFSLLALTLRFTEDAQLCLNQSDLIRGYVEAARTLISKRIFDGAIELSTIQSLCLLSLVHFTGMLSLYFHAAADGSRWQYAAGEYSKQSSYELGPQCGIDFGVSLGTLPTR